MQSVDIAFSGHVFLFYGYFFLLLRNHQQVDVLINNAAVADLPQQLTDEGLELTVATNHLGPFLLTHLLMRKSFSMEFIVSALVRTFKSVFLLDPHNSVFLSLFLIYLFIFTRSL